MPDNEIIKALERMSKEDPEGFSADILDLINRQQAEIERLKKDKADIIDAVEYRINQAKEFAYKKFAKQLQDLRERYDVCAVIDNFLAELTPTALTKVNHSSLCETETYEG